MVGAVYAAFGCGGRRVQRAELRFDGLAGCLRTPGGGSSRQFLVVVEGGPGAQPLADRRARRRG